MSSEQTIPLATARGDGAHGEEPVSMPVDELLGSNGLVTGQSGAAPAESVYQLATSLLDAGETVVVVDPAGDFDALVDHAAVLHVGGDRDCDVRVGPSAVDRVASLALDGNTSVVLDLTAFDASAADDLLGGLTDELVDARGPQRTDLLLVVNECHRWLSANGQTTRTAENLVQLGGRRHEGVGIVGITDQPADVREDVRSGVDWILAHRLTWQEDVRALEGLLDRHHVDALETLEDGEAIYNAGWEPSASHVSVGATASAPVADRTSTSSDDDQDLFAGLPAARSHEDDAGAQDHPDTSDARADGDLAALRNELDEMENRVAALEAKLEAREAIEDVADRIADAITDGLRDADVGQPGRTAEHTTADPKAPGGRSNETDDSERPDTTTDDNHGDDGPGGFGDVFGMFDDDDATAETDAEPSGSARSATTSEPSGADAGTAADNADSPTSADVGSMDADPSAGANGTASTHDSSSAAANGADGGGMSFEPVDFGFEDPADDVDSTIPDDFGPPARNGSGTGGRTIPSYLKSIVRSLEEMDATTRRMLAHYIEEGTDAPMDAHYAAGGGGDRTRAYAHNRQLRTNGLVEHVGKGKYAPRLREYVVDEAGHSVPEHELDRAVDVIRQTVEAA